MHVWDLKKRRHLQALDLGDAHQMVLELRPAHDPRKAYGFVGVVVSVEDLSASVWLWHRDGPDWAIKKVITIPAEPAEAEQLPELLQGLRGRAAAGDRYQPFARRSAPVRVVLGHRRLHPVRRVRPVQPGRDRPRAPGWDCLPGGHPAGGQPLTGGPQMVEVSRDGKRIYLTNGLYTSWDKQFYPAGVEGWVAKLDVPDGGGLEVDTNFVTEGLDGRIPHQIRLEGGDSSSDSFCFS